MIAKSEIKKCQIDKIYFINKYIQKLYKNQELILQNENRNKIIEKARQTGVTDAVLLDSIHNAFFNPGTTAVIFSETLAMGNNIIKNINNLYCKLPDFIKKLFPIKDVHDLQIEFINKSKIYIKTYKQYYDVCSLSIDFLAMDDIYDFSDFEHFWNNISMALNKNKKVYIYFTPGVSKNVKSLEILKGFDMLYLDSFDLYKLVSFPENSIIDGIKKCNKMVLN